MVKVAGWVVWVFWVFILNIFFTSSFPYKICKFNTIWDPYIGPKGPYYWVKPQRYPFKNCHVFLELVRFQAGGGTTGLLCRDK